ncbi:type II secretion system protein M [Gallaecimonas xiamenensis]|uniref:Type II secretion system protein M n=1 Tax=Gallaecimonas xiamenensis 3-C-1 TaxID=745411 RepID=K2K3N2_9GAMM|nr:type II secretion system protein M [Gallaecimonas xiamenensis]EKE77564.1 general secretion protein M [Gallaecimonas xiamenensis 3-C-1]
MIKEYWQAMAPRDRQVLTWAAPFMALGLFYFAIWQPLSGAEEAARQQLQSRQGDLQYLREQGSRLLAAKGGRLATGSGSLTDRVTRSANSFNVRIARLQPGQGGISVWVDEVPFERLTQWLTALQLKEGLSVSQADVITTGTPGMVRVRRLELTGA